MEHFITDDAEQPASNGGKLFAGFLGFAAVMAIYGFCRLVLDVVT
jgi:hypothetical protein